MTHAAFKGFGTVLLRFVVSLLDSLLGLGGSVGQHSRAQGSGLFHSYFVHAGRDIKHASLSASASNKDNVDILNRVSRSPVSLS